MIKRDAIKVLKRFAMQYPVVTVTGPRQSGKTTIVQHVFKNMPYYNLEKLSHFEFAENDPEGFMEQMPDGGIIDEIQKVPKLLSLIQVISDKKKQNGLFIITGSSQLQLMQGISQSLAGRTALLTLLPLSLNEIRNENKLLSNSENIFRGFMPRIVADNLNPAEALDFYFRTYVERDVRVLGQIKNLTQFQMFVKMCAGRIGQLLNLSSLGNDVGISHTTAREWISILKAGYVVFTLEPFFENIGKRLMKSPKLYFHDTGLAATLLGVENEEQILTHPSYGNLFENMVVSEFIKYRFNRGKTHNLSFFRDSKGNEVDLLYSVSHHKIPIEIKAGATISSDFFKGLKYFEKLFPKLPYGKLLVYGGKDIQRRSETLVITPEVIDSELEKLEV